MIRGTIKALVMKKIYGAIAFRNNRRRILESIQTMAKGGRVKYVFIVL